MYSRDAKLHEIARVLHETDGALFWQQARQDHTGPIQGALNEPVTEAFSMF